MFSTVCKVVNLAVINVLTFIKIYGYRGLGDPRVEEDPHLKNVIMSKDDCNSEKGANRCVYRIH